MARCVPPGVIERATPEDSALDVEQVTIEAQDSAAPWSH